MFQEICRRRKENEIEPRSYDSGQKSVDGKVLNQFGIDTFSLRFSCSSREREEKTNPQ